MGQIRMNAHPVLLQKKYTRVISLFASENNLSLDEALDFFYRSETGQLIREGVSDLHCMSDAYLSQELREEFANL